VVVSTPGGGLAIITHLHFRAPKGEEYHGKGIAPDFPVIGGGAELLAKAVEVAHSLVGTQPLARQGLHSPKRRQDMERIEANRAEHRHLSAGAIEFK
jgi:C-terminal processing protease CtpA/Prc